MPLEHQAATGCPEIRAVVALTGEVGAEHVDLRMGEVELEMGVPVLPPEPGAARLQHHARVGRRGGRAGMGERDGEGEREHPGRSGAARGTSVGNHPGSFATTGTIAGTTLSGGFRQ